jgi:hypothetical protein
MLKAAVAKGLRPKVHEAFRSPAESDRKQRLWKEGKGGQAAAGWGSCHNYGLAMDVYLYDRNGHWIHDGVKGWYAQYKLLAKTADGMVWGQAFGMTRHSKGDRRKKGDADHFEFHPNWSGGTDGPFLLKVKEWAQRAAGATPGADTKGSQSQPKPAEWMPFFWWAAGAGGTAPPPSFLAKDPPPVRH